MANKMSKTVEDCGSQPAEEEKCWRCGCFLCGGTGIDPDEPGGYIECDCVYQGVHTTGNKCLYEDAYGDRLKPVEVVLGQRIPMPGWFMIDFVIPYWRLAEDWDEEE